jgi:hypothetical protein
MNLTNAQFDQIRIPGITPVSELGNGGIRKPQSIDNAAAPRFPVTAEPTIPSVEHLLMHAEQLARTDTSSKEQHFVELLRAQPEVYEAYLQAQSRSEAPEQTWP